MLNTMDHSWRKLPQNEDAEESEDLLPSGVSHGGVRSKPVLSLQLLCSFLKYAVVATVFFVFGLMFQYSRIEQALSGTSSSCR